MDYLLSFLFTGIEVLSLSFVADGALKRKKRSLVQFYGVLFGTICLCIAAAIALRAAAPLFRFAVSITILFLALWRTYEGALVRKLFICIVFFIFISVIDYSAMGISMLWLSYTYVSLVQDVAAYILGVFSSKLILLLAAYLFKRIFSRRHSGDSVTPPLVGALLVVPLFSVFNLVVVVGNAIESSRVNAWLFVVAAGSLLCNVVMVFLWDQLEAGSRLKLENTVLQHEVKSTMEKTEELEELYARQRRLTHDFKNHADALQGFLEAKEYDQALRYVQNWTQNILRSSPTVHTNNSLLDVVLNQKYEQAAQKGVGVSFLLSDLGALSFPAADLVTLLANVLDNAMEAAARYEGEKTIRVKMQQKPDGTLLISVSNTSAPVEVFENSIKTTKSNASEHGFGLQNVRRIVQKYKGQFLLSYQEPWFHFTAVFPEMM